MDDGYLLCASPRSGSTLLCDLLIRTGAVGEPRSYFREPSIARYARSWGLVDDERSWGAEYAAAVRRHGAGSSGRFGMRIMWRDLPGVLARLERWTPAEQGQAEVLRAAFGVTRYVHLSRDDALAQAVSLTLAQQTGLWHRNADGSDRERHGAPTEPRYDRTQIADALRMMEHERRGWAGWFAANDIEPLAVTYEQLAVDPAATTTRVLAHLGRPDVEVPEVGTARLSTELNARWCERFRNESVAS
ncbi:MAG: Stf0 family sulfotransferase [Actinomycetota bacterium]